MRKSLTPLTGIVFIALAVVSSVLAGEPPGADEGAPEIVRHYVENEDSVIVGAILSGFAIVALLFFANHLRVLLRRAEPAGAELSPLVLTGAIVLCAGVGFDSALAWGMAEAAEDVDPVAIQAMQAIWDNDFLPMAAGLALMFLSAGLSIVRYRGLPVWLGWVALVIGIAAITPVGFFAFLVGGLWVLVVAVLLLVGEGREAPAAPAGTA